MQLTPIQHNPQFYSNPNAFLVQDEKSPDNRMDRSQESGDIRGRCNTCLNRRYQDVSDDPGVSFQTPTRMTPGQAATAVHAHEREHFVREEYKAQREGREVIHNSIRIFTDTCPECGIQYVSGGETRTKTRGPVEGALAPNGQEEQEGNGAPKSGLDILA